MAGWKFFLDGNEVEEPIGWDAIEFTAIRMESHGIDQPFSTEVNFYDKGARYIKKIYDQYFINQPIEIQIISDTIVDGQPYEFNGFLNLAIYEEFNSCDTDTFSVKVGIIDDEFREQFKSRQDIEIDLSVDKDLNGDAIDSQVFDTIRMHKQDLYLVAQGGTTPENNFGDYWKWNYIDGWSRDQFDDSRFASVIPIIWQKNDFKAQFGSAIDYNGLPFTYNNAFFVNNQNVTRTINVSLSFIYTIYFPVASAFGTGDPDGQTMNGEFTLMVISGSNTIEQQITIHNTPLVVYQNSSVINVPFSSTTTIVVPPGRRVIACAQWGEQGGFKRYVDYYYIPQLWGYLEAIFLVRNVCASITEIYSGGYGSFCQTLTIEKYLRRIIYKLTGENNKLISDAFSQSNDGCYWNNALTNGLRIRNASTINSVTYGCEPPEVESVYQLKTTWKKTFEDLDRIFCLGWAFEWNGAEWKIRVEPREYFYQNVINNEFTNVAEVTQSVKVDLLSNNINLGFTDNWKNIATSGAWAIHTDRNYFIANKAMNDNSSARLDIRSNIIAEGYAIEFSRRLINFTDDSASSDRPNDYDIFIIWLNRNELTIDDVEDSEYAIEGETGLAIFNPGEVSMSSNRITTSNSPLNAIYNVYHTPARIAARWWKVLGMNTYGMVQPIMQYQVGQYQTSYSSAISDSVESCQQFPSNYLIAENSNIYALLLRITERDYLFKPIEIEFKYPQSLCDFLILADQQPYGKVRVESGSLIVSGYITNIANQPEDNSGGTTSFKLLASNIADPEPTGERAYSSAYSNAYL